MSFDKNENHGLEMHVKSFEVFLDHALFFTHTPPPPCPVRGGGGVLSFDKNDNGLKMHVILSHFNKCCFLPIPLPPPHPARGRGGGVGLFDYSVKLVFPLKF